MTQGSKHWFMDQKDTGSNFAQCPFSKKILTVPQCVDMLSSNEWSQKVWVVLFKHHTQMKNKTIETRRNLSLV